MFFELIVVQYAICGGCHVHSHIIRLILLLKRVIIILILIILPFCKGLEDIFVLNLTFFVGFLLHEVLFMFFLSNLLHLSLPHKQFLNR